MDHDRVWPIEGSDGPETGRGEGGVNQCNHEISEAGESKGRHVAFHRKGGTREGGRRVTKGRVTEFVYRFDISVPQEVRFDA